jgi:hypothetical protein
LILHYCPERWRAVPDRSRTCLKANSRLDAFSTPSEWSPSGGEGNVFVTIEADGKVKVSSPVVDQGAGVLTVIF